MARVQLNGISKRYGRTAAVEPLSMVIEQGELVALLGPSGCGKTTTLRMIAGFIRPTTGTISIGDRDVTELPPYRRNTGMVFQGYALFPHMTVAENVAFGLRMRKVAPADVERSVVEALRLVRLEGYGERLPRQLSGGQQQRVALARALVVQPDVLLLDEPLSNLDAKLRHDVRIEIRQLQQSLGLTTVFVTHDQEEALTVADRLVIMSRGEVQQVGGPRELYQAPANRFVADFIGKSNFFEGEALEDGRFRTESGLEVVCSNPGPGAGGGRVLALRPELIRLIDGEEGDPDAVNRVRGCVEFVTYLGSTTEYRVRLHSGDSVLVHAQNDRSRRGREFGVGEEPLVTWSADAGLVLDATTEETSA